MVRLLGMSRIPNCKGIFLFLTHILRKLLDILCLKKIKNWCLKVYLSKYGLFSRGFQNHFLCMLNTKIWVCYKFDTFCETTFLGSGDSKMCILFENPKSICLYHLRTFSADSRLGAVRWNYVSDQSDIKNIVWLLETTLTKIVDSNKQYRQTAS